MAQLTDHMIVTTQADMYAAKFAKDKQLESKYDKIYNVETHKDNLGSKETGLLGAGELTQATGEYEDIPFRGSKQSWTTLTEYQLFFDGLKLSKTAVERVEPTKVTDLMKKLASTWSRSEIIEKETYAATGFNESGALSGNDVFNGSFGNDTDSSGNLLYDSVPLCALSGNNHVPKGGGTGYFNAYSGLSLTAANFQTLYTLHTSTNNVDERNRKIRNKPNMLLTETGDDAITAYEILNSTGKPDTDINNINAYSRFGLMHMDWDYLNDSGAFYLIEAKCEELTFVNAQPAEIRFSRDEDNLAYKASINLMFSLWFREGVWKKISRAGGTYA